MILLDSSVWIDWLGLRDTVHTLTLERLLIDGQRVGVPDLALTEVLKGTRGDAAFRKTLAKLLLFEQIAVVDGQVAIASALNYRRLRALGITPRKTIDTLIATRCILDGIPLLYADRDFDPFVQHLGLRSAMDLPTGAN